ncbi:hypothetical protein [uncultured Marinobacter sp.]|uniref:hypothetical protein n=1 Tax=uncultured Marinobacter sp. TaxID=187379 RepID=UPI0030DA491D|tara:strand:+ start:1097 stop:1414 length:318 start_codon:yes stop_codon:yes gene_type:complete
MGKVVSLKGTTAPLEMPESLTLLQMAKRWKVWVKTGVVCVEHGDKKHSYFSETFAFVENDGEVSAYQRSDGENCHLYNWTASTEASEDADDRLLEIIFKGTWIDD